MRRFLNKSEYPGSNSTEPATDQRQLLRNPVLKLIYKGLAGLCIFLGCSWCVFTPVADDAFSVAGCLAEYAFVAPAESLVAAPPQAGTATAAVPGGTLNISGHFLESIAGALVRHGAGNLAGATASGQGRAGDYCFVRQYLVADSGSSLPGQGKAVSRGMQESPGREARKGIQKRG